VSFGSLELPPLLPFKQYTYQEPEYFNSATFDPLYFNSLNLSLTSFIVKPPAKALVPIKRTTTNIIYFIPTTLNIKKTNYSMAIPKKQDQKTK
jgi:hypothetical protein